MPNCVREMRTRAGLVFWTGFSRSKNGRLMQQIDVRAFTSIFSSHTPAGLPSAEASAPFATSSCGRAHAHAQWSVRESANERHGGHMSGVRWAGRRYPTTRKRHGLCVQ